MSRVLAKGNLVLINGNLSFRGEAVEGDFPPVTFLGRYIPENTRVISEDAEIASDGPPLREILGRHRFKGPVLTDRIELHLDNGLIIRAKHDRPIVLPVLVEGEGNGCFGLCGPEAKSK